MPPAFNLSQDQTLQFNLYALFQFHQVNWLISLKANYISISRLCVSIALYIERLLIPELFAREL